MTYEKKPFEYENIPDYALKPAREAPDIDNSEADQFDPTAYDRILGASESVIKEHEIPALNLDSNLSNNIASVSPPSMEKLVNEKIEPIKEIELMPQKISQIKIDEEIKVEEKEKPEPIEEINTAEKVIAEREEKNNVEATAKVETIEEIQEEKTMAAMPKEEIEAEETIKPEPVESIKAEDPKDAESMEETTADTVSNSEEEPEEVPVSAPPREEEPEEVPASAPPREEEPEAVPVSAPPSKVAPVKIIPLVGSLESSKLKLVDIKDKPKTKVYIEEDILVPDVKPDLSTVLAVDGKIKLSEKEVSVSQNGADSVKVTGDLVVETLYLPDTSDNGDQIISIESKLPFKSECNVGAAPYSNLVITPQIDSIEYIVINERKVRIKSEVTLGLKEYGNLDVDLFEGVKGEEVQMLKEKIRVTDVALRKSQTMEVKEELALKESMPEIDTILKSDINVVENHKQISKEKAVINASIYCNVMYLGKSQKESLKSSEESAEIPLEPVLFQGKTEFTQFIKLSDDIDTESKNLVGSKVDFDINSFSLAKKESEDGKATSFDLESIIDTSVELYQNIEKEIVTDVYHNVKDIQYETEELGLMSLSGSGASEVSVREIINVPEKNGAVDRIAYMSGDIKETNSIVDEGKSIVEGLATINLICIAEDENKTAFNLKKEIPFRSSIDIPGAKPDMQSSNQLTLKDIWFDKINNRQIEVNAGIALTTTVSKEEKHKLIKNVSFIEMPEGDHTAPSIILYITRDGDNIWKIAKKYRTTIDEIKKINELEYANEIKPGTKLLIVSKSH
ncbi:DUF3794 and LysM peptidoglycan-binding domain-containing protein [Anaerovorax odorimutans]|uniref:DUF3794 and LysM peptidoglycan-binding domain-containing protein n=1 Tax=Anaerovorax odorimutans TaxID=109327 RepID=UPI0003FE5575|nr:SPOCS domain-containing protein [Anaerovorax odorimutans]